MSEADRKLADDTIELLCEGQVLLTNAQWQRDKGWVSDEEVAKYKAVLEQRKLAVKMFLLDLMDL